MRVALEFSARFGFMAPAAAEGVGAGWLPGGLPRPAMAEARALLAIGPVTGSAAPLRVEVSDRQLFAAGAAGFAGRREGVFGGGDGGVFVVGFRVFLHAKSVHPRFLVF